MSDASGSNRRKTVALVADSNAAEGPTDGTIASSLTRLGAWEPATATARLREAPPAWTVEAVTQYQAFLDLEPVWNKLVDEANADHPFIRHEWVRTWWACFGAGHELCILVVRANREVVAIVPLMLCERRLCGLPVRQLQSIWNVYVERFDFIVGRWTEAAYRATLTFLANQKNWNLLLLCQLPTGSPSLTELPRLAAEQGMRVGLLRSADSPYVPLVGSWESYCQGLERKHRSNLRNREKRLCRLGSLSLEVVSSAEHLADALEDGFRLEAAAWKGRAGTAIRTRPDTRRFYAQLAQAAAERGALRLCFLTLDGERIAFGYYLEYGNKLYLLKPGYDPRFARYSPSNLLCYLVLRDAFQRGIVEVDFLAAADPWKLRWTTSLRTHYWLYLFPDRLTPRFLHWAKFRLLPRLGEQRVLRAARDVALNIVRVSRRMVRRWPLLTKPVTPDEVNADVDGDEEISMTTHTA